MNERIKELAEQAGFNFRVDCATDDEIIRIYKNADKVEKLAELIVRECAELMEEQHTWMTNVSASKMIRMHFGVE